MELNLIYISGSSCQISFSINLIPRGFFLTFKSVVVYLPYTKNAHADRVNSVLLVTSLNFKSFHFTRSKNCKMVNYNL